MTKYIIAFKYSEGTPLEHRRFYAGICYVRDAGCCKEIFARELHRALLYDSREDAEKAMMTNTHLSTGYISTIHINQSNNNNHGRH